MPLTNAHYPHQNPAWAAAGSPSGMWRESFDRKLATTDLAALTTQIMTTVGIYLEVGDLVTNLTFKSGATAAGTPTNWWYALYSTAATPALLAQSADQLTAAWAANTTKTLALSTAYPVPASGWYYAAVMVKATTVPTLVGLTTFAGASGGVLTADKALAQTSGSSLTTTAPATIATPTSVSTVAYCAAT